jgi:hypothetical protein
MIKLAWKLINNPRFIMNTKFLMILCSLFVMVGCAHVGKLVIDNAKRKPTDSVELFQGTFPTNNYKCIAMLTYSCERKDELKAISYFISEGKQSGGNAIIIQWPPVHNSEAWQHGNNAGISEIYDYRAGVVVWSNDSNDHIRF